MEGPLAPHVVEVEVGARTGDPIEQAPILWRILYSIVVSYQNRHPDWVSSDMRISQSIPTGHSSTSSNVSACRPRRGRGVSSTAPPTSQPAEAPEGRLHHIKRTAGTM